MAQLRQIMQGHPKPAFSENVQRGHQGKFFKSRPKRSPRLKRLKALWRRMALSSNKYALNVQRLEKILVQKAAPKVPE